MRRIILVLLLCVTAVATAEDTFLQDFNIYAENVYGIEKATFIANEAGTSYYMTGSVVMSVSSSIVVYGEDHLDVISAACCALRWYDNGGNIKDQYGTMLSAYYLVRARDNIREKILETENGTKIYVSIKDKTLAIGLIK